MREFDLDLICEADSAIGLPGFLSVLKIPVEVYTVAWVTQTRYISSRHLKNLWYFVNLIQHFRVNPSEMKEGGYCLKWAIHSLPLRSFPLSLLRPRPFVRVTRTFFKRRLMIDVRLNTPCFEGTGYSARESVWLTQSELNVVIFFSHHVNDEITDKAVLWRRRYIDIVCRRRK